jgi:iduronate 2-sulfatase
MRNVQRRLGRVAVVCLAGWVAAAGMSAAKAADAAAAAPAAKAADAGKPKFNVLFIAVDDLRPNAGCYGDTFAQTPNIDRLAAQGMVFTRCYCQQALCSPTRTSLMTGRRPDTTRVYDLSTHFRKNIPDVVTLAECFKQNGYHTQGLSKIYHPGFDDPQGWSVPHWDPGAAAGREPGHPATQPVAAEPKGDAAGVRANEAWEEDAPASEPVAAAKPGKKGRGGRAGANPGKREVLERDAKTGMVLKLSPKIKTQRGAPCQSPDVPDNALADGQTADRAVQVLGEIKDKPFFLAVGFLKPHLPFIAPKKYYDQFPLDSVKLADNMYWPKDVPPIAMTDFGELRQYRGVPAKGQVTDHQAKELIRGYYAATSYTDAQIGRVIAELDRLGLRERTIVVLWGDHGWQLGEHGLWCKHTNFEMATHTLMLMSAPGKAGGRKTAALTEFVDIYPTLCDLCGLQQPKGLEGTSLAPLFDDPNRPWKSAAFSQYPRGKVMGHSMRTDRYRYTEWAEPGKPPVGVELYDHKTDPGENVNVATRPENAELASQLRGQLQAGWQAARPSR